MDFVGVDGQEVRAVGGGRWLDGSAVVHAPPPLATAASRGTQGATNQRSKEFFRCGAAITVLREGGKVVVE